MKDYKASLQRETPNQDSKSSYDFKTFKKAKTFIFDYFSGQNQILKPFFNNNYNYDTIKTLSQRFILTI